MEWRWMALLRQCPDINRCGWKRREKWEVTKHFPPGIGFLWRALLRQCPDINRAGGIVKIGILIPWPAGHNRHMIQLQHRFISACWLFAFALAIVWPWFVTVQGAAPTASSLKQAAQRLF